jgi:putative redox protein
MDWLKFILSRKVLPYYIRLVLGKKNKMITMKATYAGELRCEAIHIKSGVKLHTDAPVDNKGKGNSFSPTDLLCTSLATCMMTIMGITAQEKGIPFENVEAEIVKTMGTAPRRVVKIEIHFTFKGNDYTSKEKEILKNAALTCPVAKSLHPEIEQDIHFAFV